MLVLQRMTHTEPAYTPPKWSTGTDEEIVEALRRHYDPEDELDLHEYWSVGIDKRIVHLAGMPSSDIGDSQPIQDITLVLSNVGGKTLMDGETECAFQVDVENCLSVSGKMNSTASSLDGWKQSERRNWCNTTFYNALPSALRPVFKQFIDKSGKVGGNPSSGVEETIDYFALRAEIEVYGTQEYAISGEGSLIEYYETSSNRTKYNSAGSRLSWWLRSPSKFSNANFCMSTYSGGIDANIATNTLYLSPFGVI